VRRNRLQEATIPFNKKIATNVTYTTAIEEEKDREGQGIAHIIDSCNEE